MLTNNPPADSIQPSMPKQEPQSAHAARPLRSWWSDSLRSFRRQRPAAIALVVLLLLVLSAVCAPIVAPHDPSKQYRRDGLDASGIPLPPNGRFLLGTDGLGRDLLSRVIWGARLSLLIGILTSGLSVLIALVVGGAAGFIGGRTDTLIMRFVDVVMSVPSFFVTLLMISIFKPTPWVLVVAIAAFGWTYPARIFRAEARSLRERDYIQAARCLGIPEPQIFLRHLLPHLGPLLITYATLGIPGAIFAEAGLSYIGLGVQPPDASWGTMITDAIRFYRIAPWVVLVPGAAITITVVCFNLVGSGLRDALDPARREG